MVAYGRDGLLYVGMGDGGSGGDPENRAQNPSSLLGKILRLDPARPGTKPVIVADGVRNPWRFSFDRANGDLWIGDVGQGSIEEVDHVAWPWKGLLNFGWDVYEGRASFEQKALGPGQARDAGRAVQPLARAARSRAATSTAARPCRPPRAGTSTATTAAARSGRSSSSDGVARQIRAEPFTVKSLTSFGEDAAGELYAVSGEGQIYKLAS